MRKFKFTLESVLLIRQKALEDERIKLASIINVLNKQNDALAELIKKLDQLKHQNEQNYDGFLDIQSIVNLNAYIAKLSQDIMSQEKIIEKTKIDLFKQQENAKKAYIQLKSVEKLKEKQKAKYDFEVLQEEFKVIDDIVNSKRISA